MNKIKVMKYLQLAILLGFFAYSGYLIILPLGRKSLVWSPEEAISIWNPHYDIEETFLWKQAKLKGTLINGLDKGVRVVVEGTIVVKGVKDSREQVYFLRRGEQTSIEFIFIIDPDVERLDDYSLIVKRVDVLG